MWLKSAIGMKTGLYGFSQVVGGTGWEDAHLVSCRGEVRSYLLVDGVHVLLFVGGALGVGGSHSCDIAVRLAQEQCRQGRAVRLSRRDGFGGVSGGACSHPCRAEGPGCGRGFRLGRLHFMLLDNILSRHPQLTTSRSWPAARRTITMLMEFHA